MGGGQDYLDAQDVATEVERTAPPAEPTPAEILAEQDRRAVESFLGGDYQPQADPDRAES